MKKNLKQSEQIFIKNKNHLDNIQRGIIHPDKIEKQKSDFADQFKYKYPDNFILQVSKDNGDVDAITAATISSRAFCDAVQRAWNIYKEINEK